LLSGLEYTPPNKGEPNEETNQACGDGWLGLCARKLQFIEMSLRFRRSIKLLPGVHVNLGLHGAGLSVGPRGVHVGVNRRGMYSSAGIPGTGIYAVHHYRSRPLEHARVAGSARGGCGLLMLFIVILLALAMIGQK
jgi:Protein of unknown function (DUF4236)